MCEVVVRHLEEVLGSRRSGVTRPETDGSGPPVELRLLLADHRYAIEHTLIEPYPRALLLGRHFQEFVEPILEELDHTMPVPGIYDLVFPLDPMTGRHRRTHSELRAEIIDWVRKAAEELWNDAPSREDRDRFPSGRDGERRTEIHGLPLSLRRRVHWAQSGRHDGRIFVMRLVEEEMEELRAERLQTALDRKLGKLGRCKDEGDITVLILENTDPALTNHVLVAESLGSLLNLRSDGPDHVFIVDTTIPDEWSLFRPVIGGIFDIDMDWIEVRPSEASDPVPDEEEGPGAIR